MTSNTFTTSCDTASCDTATTPGLYVPESYKLGPTDTTSTACDISQIYADRKGRLIWQYSRSTGEAIPMSYFEHCSFSTEGEYTTWDTAKNQTWVTEQYFSEIAIGDRLRKIIKDRQAPIFVQRKHIDSSFHPGRRMLKSATTPQEVKARETLRRIIGNDRFKNYLH